MTCTSGRGGGWKALPATISSPAATSLLEVIVVLASALILAARSLQLPDKLAAVAGESWGISTGEISLFEELQANSVEDSAASVNA